MAGSNSGTSAAASTRSTPMIGAHKPDEVVVTPTPIEGWRVLNDDPFEHNVYDLFDTAAELLISKHHDYGPRNISLSPGGPLNGLRVRMWDKIARINNLIDNGTDPEHESLKDSFIDLCNYSIIACLVLDGDWPTG